MSSILVFYYSSIRAHNQIRNEHPKLHKESEENISISLLSSKEKIRRGKKIICKLKNRRKKGKW